MKIKEITVNEGINDKYIFKAVFTAGSPAAGKTTVSRKLLSHMGFREVNIDRLLEFFAETKGLDLKNMHTWDEEIFKKAEDINLNAMEMFIKNRMPLLIDGTGRNYKKIKALAEHLKTFGYDVGLIFVNVTMETSVERSTARAEQGGRKVDRDFLEDAWKKTQANIGIFQDYFDANMFIVDNDVIQKSNLDLVSKRIDRFLDKPVRNNAARSWLTDEMKRRNVTRTKTNITEEHESSDEFLERIKKECAPFFAQIGGIQNWKDYQLWHGSRINNQKNYQLLAINQERKPTDTPIMMHNAWNEAFLKAGYPAHRGNSIFTTGSSQMAEGYNSTPYVILPIGNFNFSWSADFKDLYDDGPYRMLVKDGYITLADDFEEKYSYSVHNILDSVKSIQNLDQAVKKFYQKQNLVSAIEAENEIMINARSVYLISDTFFKILTS